MVSERYRCIYIILTILCLVVSGCDKKSGSDQGGATVSQADIDAVRDAMTRDMQKVAFSSLDKTHIGRTCVVTAQTMEDSAQLGPPPPPPGMLRVLGSTTIYNAELDAVDADSLTVRAAYPTSGKYKKIEIAEEDIQSIHLAP